MDKSVKCGKNRSSEIEAKILIDYVLHKHEKKRFMIFKRPGVAEHFRCDKTRVRVFGMLQARQQYMSTLYVKNDGHSEMNFI